MTDIPQEVVDRVRLWQARLGLNVWDIEFDVGTLDECAACGTTGGEASPEPEYFKATITLDLDKIGEGQLDAFIVHELLHCYVHRLANAANAMAKDDSALLEWVRTEEETLVSLLERVVLRLSTPPRGRPPPTMASGAPGF